MARGGGRAVGACQESATTNKTLEQESVIESLFVNPLGQELFEGNKGNQTGRVAGRLMMDPLLH